MTERYPAGVIVSEEDALALAFRYWPCDDTFLEGLIDRMDPQALQHVIQHVQARKQKILDERESQKENASDHKQGSN